MADSIGQFTATATTRDDDGQLARRRALPRRTSAVRRPRPVRREEQQERHHREPVAREHIEHDDARRVGGEQERKNGHSRRRVRPRAIRPRSASGHDDAEVADRAEHAQEQRRDLLVALLALGVQHLAAVPEQRQLAAHERQPAPGLARDERQRPGRSSTDETSAGVSARPSARSASSVASCRSNPGAPRPGRSDM